MKLPGCTRFFYDMELTGNCYRSATIWPTVIAFGTIGAIKVDENFFMLLSILVICLTFTHQYNSIEKFLCTCSNKAASRGLLLFGCHVVHILQKTRYYFLFINHATSCRHCKRYKYTHFSCVRNDRNQYCLLYTLCNTHKISHKNKKKHQYLIYCKNADIKFNCAIYTQIGTNRIKFE